MDASGAPGMPADPATRPAPPRASLVFAGYGSDSDADDERRGDAEEDDESDEGQGAAVVVDDVAFVAELVGALPDVQRDRDSDDDVVVETGVARAPVPPRVPATDRMHVDDDDDDDDDDDESSTSSSSSSSSDGEGEAAAAAAAVAGRTPRRSADAADAADAADDDDEGGRELTPRDIRTKHEQDELPQVEEYTEPLPEHVAIVPLGVVHAVVDAVVVVQTTAPGVSALDAGSLLCFRNRHVLGKVYETFGPVPQPLYSVLFNAPGKIDRSVVVLGAPVFHAPSYASYVFPEQLLTARGSDASNLFDEEVDDEECEFSDDEKEMEHRRQLKQARRGGPVRQPGADGEQARRPPASPRGGRGAGRPRGPGRPMRPPQAIPQLPPVPQLPSTAAYYWGAPAPAASHMPPPLLPAAAAAHGYVYGYAWPVPQPVYAMAPPRPRPAPSALPSLPSLPGAPGGPPAAGRP